MRIFNYTIGLCSFLVFISLTNSGFSQGNKTKDAKPNIVLILIDDSGLMDLGAFGGEARTPNIDKLASAGLMFTNMHASPVCAPSRAMLLTGTDSHLAGVANLPEFLSEEYQQKPGYEGVLNDRVQTIATRLKEAQYNTYMTGKWHLGHDEKTLPSSRGFDRTFVLGGSGASNYDSHGYLPMKPQAHWYADGKEVELPEDFYSSKTYIDKTIEFHEAEQKKDNPFFAYIAFQAIHAPIQAPKEFVDHYKETYKEGWNKLRQERFEKAKELGFIPQSTQFSDIFPKFKKWEDLSEKEKESQSTRMSVTAGMLEAMDFHIGRYIEYLTQKGLMENTIFIVTSDNGPDGADYTQGLVWARRNGYHTDFNKKGGKGFFGFIGPEFANAISAPFSYCKYYTGEGGIRVPLIISGVDIPKNQRTNVFTFFTDIAPTIYDLVGLPINANPGFAPITGKSMLPHIKDQSVPVYAANEGIGLEAAASSAYFLNGYKIVKNNIPLGDTKWHLYDLENDPSELNDLAQKEPERFQKMLAGYEAYAREVGVLDMPEGYSAQGTVARKSYIKMFLNWLPYLLILLLGIIGLFIWRKKRNKRANFNSSAKSLLILIAMTGTFSGCTILGLSKRSPRHIYLSESVPEIELKREPKILTAFFGLDNGLTFRARAIYFKAQGKDGMPLVFSHELDPKTLDGADFAVTTKNGTIHIVEAASFLPANEEFELRTVLLIGEYGNHPDNPPVSVEVVGDLKARTGQNFKGSIAKVIPLEEGPVLSYAEYFTLDEEYPYIKKGKGCDCPKEETKTVVKIVWSGGVRAVNGKELGENELDDISVTLVNGSDTMIVKPYKLADLGDSENNIDLCIKQPGIPILVQVNENIAIDPNNDKNPKTQIEVMSRW